MKASADRPRRHGYAPRPGALSNEEVWAEVLKHPDVMRFALRWCGQEEGIAWLAMFNIGRMWKPDGGSSFRSYVRSWTKFEARALWLGGGSVYATGGVNAAYAILTKAQRVFGEANRTRDLLLQDIVPDDTPESQWGPDECEQVRADLADLPAPQREVLEARFFRHLTLREVAVERGISLARVQQIQVLGLARLRAAIKRRGNLWRKENA